MLSSGPATRRSRPARILFTIARGDSFGGSSMHVMDLADRLRDAGCDTRILVGGNPDMEVPRRFAERDLDFVCLPTLGRPLRPLHDTRALLRLRQEIHRFRPDLLSLHSSKAGCLGRIASLGLGLPVLYTPHCWAFVEGQERSRFYHHVERWLSPLATHIVTVCEDERHFGLRNGVGRPEQFTTIHNGVRDASPDIAPREASPDGLIRIAMVGRFEEQKDQALLLSALAGIRHLPWKLTLVGEGPLRSQCLEQVHRDGIADRVDFTGYSDGVEKILSDHDLFALITKWEGFPRSLLEAMSASLPVLASDVGGCREAVEDGKNGRLVPPGDLDALTQALREILEAPEQLAGMGRAARKRYLDEFTLGEMLPRYRELYQELLEEPLTGSRPLPAKPAPSRRFPLPTPAAATARSAGIPKPF